MNLICFPYSSSQHVKKESTTNDMKIRQYLLNKLQVNYTWGS